MVLFESYYSLIYLIVLIYFIFILVSISVSEQDSVFFEKLSKFVAVKTPVNNLPSVNFNRYEKNKSYFNNV